MMTKLKQLRVEIDAVDRKMVELLAERFSILERVAHYKANHGVPARIPTRMRTVVERQEAAARGLGLPRRAAANVWKAIVEEACRFEESLIEDEPIPKEGMMAKTTKRKSVKSKATRGAKRKPTKVAAKKAVAKKTAKRPAKQAVVRAKSSARKVKKVAPRAKPARAKQISEQNKPRDLNQQAAAPDQTTAREPAVNEAQASENPASSQHLSQAR